MAIIQALLMALSRRAGQLVNTVFGWATQLLFGKVTKDRQGYISGMSLGAVVWLVSVIGIVFPGVGAFLLTAIPIPDWVQKDWIRWTMLAIAVLLPLLIGWLGVKAQSPEDRPEGQEYFKTLLRGYSYAFALSLTLILMTLFAPFMMLPLLAKRWTTTHVPLLVEAKEYDEILGDIEDALDANGWDTTPEPANWMVRLPTKLLVSMAGPVVDRFVADNLTTLRAENLEVTLHPADLVISGKEFEVVRVRAVLTERLAFSSANQTWTKEANELENAVTGLWNELRAGRTDARTVRKTLKQLAIRRNHLKIEFEEWEVLERQHLLVERLLLDGDAALTPAEENKPDAKRKARRAVNPEEAKPAGDLLPRLGLGAVLALLRRFQKPRHEH